MDFLEQPLLRLNDIFVQSPGDFLYFLAITILIFISFVMAMQLRDRDHAFLRRYPVALGSIIFVWGLMFAGALYVTVMDQAPYAILPPLERGVSATTLILLAWAFIGPAQPNASRGMSNRVTLLMLFAVSVGYLVSGVMWVNLSQSIDFNISYLGIIWALALYILAIAGLLMTVLSLRHIIDAPLKLVYFVLLATGTGITLYQVTQVQLIGNDAGIFRLFFLLAHVLVPLIVYRMVVARYEHRLIEARNRPVTQPLPVQTVPQRVTSPSEKQVTSTDAINARLLKALGQMLESGQPADIPTAIVNTISVTLQADISALLRLQDANYADLEIAHDHMLERELSGLSLNLDHQPTLNNAIERRVQRALYVDRNGEELDDFYTRIDINEHQGPVYFQPLIHRQETFAVIMLAMPYTQRELTTDETELLTGMGIVAGNLLALSYSSQEAANLAEDRIIQAMVEGVPPSDVQAQEMLQARLKMQENLTVARDQIAQLTKQVLELKLQLDDEQGRMQEQLSASSDSLSISQQMRAITDQQETLREERDQLLRRLQEAEAALQGALASDNETVINNMVEALRREKQALETEKKRLESQLDAFRMQEQTAPGDMQRLLNRMIEEKARLEQDRDQLNEQLQTLENQLHELGIDTDEAGLAQLIGVLYEERAALTEENDLLRQERAALLSERKTLAGDLSREKDRDSRIEVMQDQIEGLAADKETLSRQRDKLRAEREAIEQKLNVVKEHRARLLAQSAAYELDLTDAREEKAQLQAKLQDLSNERSDLLNRHDKLRAENHALTTELEQLMSQFDGDPARLKQVNDEGLGSLRQMVDELSEQRDQLTRELNETQAQLAHVQQELANARILTVADGTSVSYQPNEPELLMGLVQEFRTPMTTISGLVQLLRSESAGILGAMQRKFLQRIAANVTRLETMIESLVNLTQLDTGNYRIKPRDVNFIRLVESALTNASVQFHDKELAVTLDLDDEMPLLPADEDSMREVIDQLLSNAYLVSPPKSTISIKAVCRPVRYETDDDPRPSIAVSVTDSGGGIDPDDIPRVFARKYRADNPLVEGLGDTGVGMSIARALVEAHEGRLWVETQQGTGSTFTFAIPLDLAQETQED